MDTIYPTAGYGDYPNMMHAYVMGRCREAFAAVNAEKAALSSAEQVRERQARVRQAFMDAIGGLPERAADPRPVWGELRDRGEYSVQNVMFQAAPEVYVTATVWRPVGWEGPRPGVLYACGHHEHPRIVQEYQEVCTWFAVNGYVTLAFDPPGQGERKLCWDPIARASFGLGCVGEHERAGWQCELVGHNIARYFVRDGMSAFDVLAGLPEVDATRIAVTGNSGGGTQSSYLMLADERLAAAMPCTFTTTREAWISLTMYHDAEQNINGALINGIDYDDYYFVFAPRPAAIGAVRYDYFPIEGSREAFSRLKRAYALLGAEEKIALFEVDSDHMYHPQLRRHAIEWFNRWLQPGEAYRDPTSFQPEDEKAQWNTATGQVASGVPGSRGVFEQNLDALHATQAGRHVPSREELKALLRLPTEHHGLNPRILAKREEGALRFEKGFIVPEAGIFLPLLRMAPERPTHSLVYCCDEGLASVGALDEAVLRNAAAEGLAVYFVDPRGIGETVTRELVAWNYASESWLAQHLRMLGTTYAALRAYDLLRTVEYARKRDGAAPVSLYAGGLVGWSAALAAALDRSLVGLCLERLRPSIAAFAQEWTALVPDPYIVPGILKSADIPELTAASGVGRVMVLNPRHVDGEAISASEWDWEHAPTWSRRGVEVKAVCRPSIGERSAALAEFLSMGRER